MSKSFDADRTVHIKNKHRNFESYMNKSLYVTGLLSLVGVGFLAYFIFRYMMSMSGYNEAASSYIPNPINHQTTPLLEGEDVPGISTASIFDMLDGYLALSLEQGDLEDRLHDYRRPFNAFLRFVYLPSLNVWKDPFMDVVDTSMMGSNFLENNPYTDISLIAQWTDFFRDMGPDTYNNINSIVVNDIVEEGDFFYIPVEVSFTAPSRRAFLFLLSKLSLTSDKNNIMLVNEFMYYVWESIVSDPSLDQSLDEVIATQSLSADNIDGDRNKLLGYALMEWRDGSIDDLPFMTDMLLEETIRRASGCSSDATFETCQFQFREKFRSIPSLAYGVGANAVDIESLRGFLSEIPPLIVLDDFTFEKTTDAAIGSDASYEGSVVMKVYGQGIVADEVDRIAQALGDECMGDLASTFSVTYAQSLVEQDLLEDVDPNVVSLQRSKDLLELQGILEDMASSYDSLTNYQKIISLFETYRMLDDALLCQ